MFNATDLVRLTCCCCLLAGCSSVSDSQWLKLPLDAKQDGKAAKDKRPAGIPKLEVAGQNLGESQEVSVSIDEFVRHVQDSLEAKRFVSASRWIARHPETALDVLHKSGSVKLSPNLLQLVARTHDQQTTRLEAGTNWESVISARLAGEASIKSYDDARARFSILLNEGRVEQALRLNLPKLAAETQQTLLQIDAGQLQGTASLLAEKPQEALAAWQQVLPTTRRISDYRTAYLLLLMSDAYRRSGDSQQATTAWMDAANTASNLLQPQRACIDPVLWERIAYLRPVNVPWPAAVVAKLNSIDPIPQLAISETAAEASLWNCLGRWYLDRGHHQSALVAFKRAEAAANTPEAKQFLRFRQARALVLLNQSGPATSILLTMANDHASPMARPALALLGSLRLQAGQSVQGVNLLRKAVEKDDGREWLERTDAEADLALAFLLIGDEAQGFQRLHRAQQRFEQQGEHESLVLSLSNEANYLTETKRSKEADALHTRVKTLEQL